jgi:hypothetical protein
MSVSVNIPKFYETVCHLWQFFNMNAKAVHRDRIKAQYRVILLLSTFLLLLFGSIVCVNSQQKFALPLLKNVNIIEKNSANHKEFSESEFHINDKMITKDQWTLLNTNDSNLQEIIVKALLSRKSRYAKHSNNLNISWPIKRAAEVEGTIILGGLMMIHEREDKQICGPIQGQGGIQALECMLHTIDWINSREDILPDITIGAYVLDDCDKDTYGLEQSVDFIKGERSIALVLKLNLVATHL